MHTSTKTQRYLLWTALALALVWSIAFVFCMGFLFAPSPTLSPAQVVELYAKNNMQFRIGVVLSILTCGFYLPWSLVVAVQMARHEKGIPILAILQGLSGAFMTGIFFLPSLLWGVAAYTVERDPALTMLVHEMAWLTFVTFGTFFPLQLIPVAIISLAKSANAPYSAFPRWIGYSTVWLVILGEVGPLAQLFKTGPFAWNGLFAYYMIFVLFGIWMGAVCYTLLRAIRQQERAIQA